MPGLSDYSNFEAVLLCQYVRANGITPDAFIRASKGFKADRHISEAKNFDAAKFSPEGLQQFFLQIWKDELRRLAASSSEEDGVNGANNANFKKRKASSPPTPTLEDAASRSELLSPLLVRVFQRHREDVITEIKEMEERHAKLKQEVGEIKRGEWDERIEQMLDDRTRKTALSQPSQSRQNGDATTSSLPPTASLPATSLPAPPAIIAATPSAAVASPLQSTPSQAAQPKPVVKSKAQAKARPMSPVVEITKPAPRKITPAPSKPTPKRGPAKSKKARSPSPAQASPVPAPQPSHVPRLASGGERPSSPLNPNSTAGRSPQPAPIPNTAPPHPPTSQAWTPPAHGPLTSYSVPPSISHSAGPTYPPTVPYATSPRQPPPPYSTPGVQYAYPQTAGRGGVMLAPFQVPPQPAGPVYHQQPQYQQQGSHQQPSGAYSGPGTPARPSPLSPGPHQPHSSSAGVPMNYASQPAQNSPVAPHFYPPPSTGAAASLSIGTPPVAHSSVSSAIGTLKPNSPHPSSKATTPQPSATAGSPAPSSGSAVPPIASPAAPPMPPPSVTEQKSVSPPTAAPVPPAHTSGTGASTSAPVNPYMTSPVATVAYTTSPLESAPHVTSSPSKGAVPSGSHRAMHTISNPVVVVPPAPSPHTVGTRTAAARSKSPSVAQAQASSPKSETIQPNPVSEPPVAPPAPQPAPFTPQPARAAAHPSPLALSIAQILAIPSLGSTPASTVPRRATDTRWTPGTASYPSHVPSRPGSRSVSPISEEESKPKIKPKRTRKPKAEQSKVEPLKAEQGKLDLAQDEHAVTTDTPTTDAKARATRSKGKESTDIGLTSTKPRAGGRGRGSRARGSSTAAVVIETSIPRQTRSSSVVSHASTAEHVMKVEPSTPGDAMDISRDDTPMPLPSKRTTAHKRKRSIAPSEVSEAPDRLSDGPSGSTEFDLPQPITRETVFAVRNFPRLSNTVMNEINSHKHASLFSAPVRDRNAAGYSTMIRHPSDLKSIRAAIAAGARIANSSTQDAISGTHVPYSEDLVPPRGIVNSSQLERQVMCMLANAVMFSPGEEGVVADAREMFEDVEASLFNFRSAEKTADVTRLVAENETQSGRDETPVAPSGKRRKQS